MEDIESKVMGEYYKDQHRYDDIINLPHHRSRERVPMSLHDRAAQFNPFAALTGHEEAIKETARLTEEKIELDESAVEKINEVLYDLSEHPEEKRRVAIAYFKPDGRKIGGAYLTDVGTVKRVDVNAGVMVMDSGVRILVGEIVGVEEIFGDGR